MNAYTLVNLLKNKSAGVVKEILGAWSYRKSKQLLPAFFCAIILCSSCKKTHADRADIKVLDTSISAYNDPGKKDIEPGKELLDTALFNKLQLYLVHNKPNAKWPVKTDYPLPGAILPYNRVVAYYGNFYSKGMGILGELPEEEMLRRLKEEIEHWKKADQVIPVIPAIHYIAVTAQASPGKGNKYRLRMPSAQIDKALELAKKIDGIVFLDVQIGHSSLQEELPALEPYLALPNVHLGIDPEYSMKGGERPCAVIGSFDGADIDYAAEYLASVVVKYQIPPKILVVHRFTQGMITNYKRIKTRREVQIVVHMDGFGFPAKKRDSYKVAVTNEPIQFAGFKLFYKNDKLSKPYHLMTPEEVIALYPSPIYIQYQ